MQINRGGSIRLLSHIVYEDANGPLQEDLILRHTCDYEWCVNEKHLLPGTQLDNVHDMIDRGRGRKAIGEGHWKAKLTETDVLAIRRSSEPGRVLADRYGTTAQYISRIRTNRTWRYLNVA